jgi:precorrin-6A/cobalt-precorrin-6A reductase
MSRSQISQLWLIGGTQESAELAAQLVQLQIPCVVTVTTEAARSLYPRSSYLRLWVGKLTPTQIPHFLQTHSIGAILDASHPFAVEISKLAIASATQAQIPYLRYERQQYQGETEALADTAPPDQSCFFPDFTSLLDSEILQAERVLLTIGYRPLPQFQDWHDRATLFARILPSPVALAAALTSGFTPDRLIAIRPPISASFEQALWQHWQISTVVTKASGTAGGETIKRQLAAELGIKLIIIERPAIAYPNQTSDKQVALSFCQTYLINP